jgi:flagellin
LERAVTAIFIRNNIPAMSAWRALTAHDKQMGRAIGRLASGLRVRTAADDASGLAISEKMRGEIRGLSQAIRNAQDGISLVQTGDGALNEVMTLLQKGRELAVQAANVGSMTTGDRESIENEFKHLISEIDNIGVSTTFNGKRLFSGNGPKLTELVDSLKSTWIKSAEQLVQAHYGFSVSNVSLKIVGDESGSSPAYVQGYYTANGNLTGLELHVNLNAFADFTTPDGASAGGNYYADRVIAHEITHAMMASQMNWTDGAMPTWFKEGSAEYIAGADDRVAADLSNGYSPADLRDRVNASSWGGTSADYSGAFAAVKYMDGWLASNGSSMTALMTKLADGSFATLDASIQAVTAGAVGISDFYTDWTVNGAAFIGSISTTDADGLGAIGRTTSDASAVIDDTADPTWIDSNGFLESWPTAVKPESLGNLQIGGKAGQTLELTQYAMSSFALGVGGLDLIRDAGEAITHLNTAISIVASVRTHYGALQNRLEHSVANSRNTVENLTASESKIRDVDMAREMADMTRQQILQQASTSMLAQANMKHRNYIQALVN